MRRVIASALRVCSMVLGALILVWGLQGEAFGNNHENHYLTVKVQSTAASVTGSGDGFTRLNPSPCTSQYPDGCKVDPDPNNGYVRLVATFAVRWVVSGSGSKNCDGAAKGEAWESTTCEFYMNGNSDVEVDVSPATHKPDPVFSDLIPAPEGSSSVTFSGTISARSMYPPPGERVWILIGLVPLGSAIIGSNGSFSTTIDVHSLPPGRYRVTYLYPGNWDLKSALDFSTTLTITSPTLITLDSFTATQEAGGVLLRWRTGREVSNLGFHIYRDGVRATLSPVAGSALLAGAQTILPAGNSYSWFDPAGTAGSSYTLEDLDISGARTVHGPVRVDGTPGLTKAARRATPGARRDSLLLSQIGRSGQPESVSLGSPARSLPSVGHSDSVEQALLAGGPAVKIGVRQEGWYRLEASQLIAAGLPSGADPARLRLIAEGREHAILVRGAGKVEAIEFYGTGLDTTFSDTRVYWLTWDGKPGARAASADSAGGGTAPASFPAAIQWRPRSLYFAALNNGDADNFFGPVVDSTDPVTQTLPATHFVPAPGSSTLQVTMQGISAGSHAIVVQVNGSEAGMLTFEGQANASSLFSIPNSLLHEGNNTLTLATYGADDVTVVDCAVLTYPHSYEADGDFLRFTAPAGAPVTVGGFTNDQIQVLDITDLANPILVSSRVSLQNGGYAASFGAAGDGERTMLAFTATQARRPVSVAANRPSSWRARQAGADMAIISNAAFIGNLAPLQALRQQQGHTVAIVDVEDIYDEFSFGEQTPYAIKDFLANAKSSWSTRPHWVLLVGDATSDPRDYLQSGKANYLPVKLVGTSQLETASDDWYVDFDDDGLPDMAIGRLPANSPAGAAAMVNRIVKFEQAGEAPWKKKALLISGRDDSNNSFEAYTSQVQGMLPLAATKVLAGSDSNARADVLAAINSGVGLVNYAGHGSTDLWEGLLDSAAAEALTNGDATPFVISMSCLNGYFQDVYSTSLAEALLSAPEGGAVAVWASSSLTGSRSQSLLNQAMIGALYGPNPATAGDAAALAKRAVNDSDTRRTWILFGDPAMRVR